MSVTKAGAARIKAIMQADKLGEPEFREVCNLGSMGGEWPTPDGFDERGRPWWHNRTVHQWLLSASGQQDANYDGPRAMRIRSRPGQRMHHRAAILERVRRGRAAGQSPRTWDDATRTCRALIASETPATVFSPENYDYVDEILLADGFNVDSDSVPVLADHERSTKATVGRGYDFQRDGTDWLAILEFGENEVGDKVREGLLDAVSIGYVVLRAVTIQPGQTATVEGRTFTAGDRVLIVATEWQLYEISVVPIGADPTARIRSHSVDEMRGRIMTTAIHSRNSVTGRHGLGALVSAALLQARVSDPSRCRAAFDHTGALVRMAPSLHTERDADMGQSLIGERPSDLIRRALELDGVEVRSYDPYRIFRAAWQYSQRDGASAGNLAGLYHNMFASLFLSAYDDAGDSTEGWVQEGDNLTYKREPANRLAGVELGYHPKGGAAEDVSVEVSAEDTQVARYSARYVLDEMDIINANSFGRLLDELIAKQMGAAARALRPNLVYATLLRNPIMSDGLPMFHADHQNVVSGELDDTGLTDLMAVIGRQEENGVKLNLRGEYLIGPVEQERRAGKLIAEVSTFDKSATRPPIVRSDSRLDNGLRDPLTGQQHEGSDSRCYLASRAPGHGLEVRYLTGTNRLPEIGVSLLRGGAFGVQIAVKHTLGVAAIGYRGLARLQPDEST